MSTEEYLSQPHLFCCLPYKNKILKGTNSQQLKPEGLIISHFQHHLMNGKSLWWYVLVGLGVGGMEVGERSSIAILPRHIPNHCWKAKKKKKQQEIRQEEKRNSPTMVMGQTGSKSYLQGTPQPHKQAALDAQSLSTRDFPQPHSFTMCPLYSVF